MDMGGIRGKSGIPGDELQRGKPQPDEERVADGNGCWSKTTFPQTQKNRVTLLVLNSGILARSLFFLEEKHATQTFGYRHCGRPFHDRAAGLRTSCGRCWWRLWRRKRW